MNTIFSEDDFLKNISSLINIDTFTLIETNFKRNINKDFNMTYDEFLYFEENNGEFRKIFIKTLKESECNYNNDDFYSYFRYINNFNDEEFNKKDVLLNFVQKYVEYLKNENEFVRGLNSYLFFIFKYLDQSNLSFIFDEFQSSFEKVLFSSEINFISKNEYMFLYCVLCKSLKKEPLIGILKYYYLCIFEFCGQAEDIDLSFSYVVYLNLYEASENFSYLNQFSYKIFDKAKKHFKNNDFFYFSLVFQKISLSVKEKIYSKNRFKANDIYYLYTERDHLKINEIFFKFSSFRQPLTINYFYSFLAQFGTLDRVRAVLKLLDKIDFFDFWKLNELMEKIILNNCVFDKGKYISAHLKLMEVLNFINI